MYHSENFTLEDASENGKSSKTRNLPALIFTLITGGVGLGITLVSVPFLLPAVRRICLPFVPATTTQVENVLTALATTTKSGGHSVTSSSRLIDLGSGDGRIVIAAAQKGYMSHGVEMNPWLVLYSRLAAFKCGLSKKTAFYRRDLWTFSLTPYNSVVIFGVEEMMKELELKMANELSTGAKVIACRFPLPNKPCEAVIGSGIDSVWIYKF